MPPVGFESTISAGERLQTHALDRAATGTDSYGITDLNLSYKLSQGLPLTPTRT